MDEQEPKYIGEFPTSLIAKSKKFPPLSLHPAITLFVKLVSKEFQKIPTSLRWENCTHTQRQALKELRSMTDVVFKPADKGGNVVVWPCTMYEKEALRQLRDTSCYKRLTFNPLRKYKVELNVILMKGVTCGVITKQQKE